MKHPEIFSQHIISTGIAGVGNMNSLSLLIIPLLCHVTWGCCTPRQWSGTFGYMVGTNKNGKGGFEAGSEKIFYDFKNTKLASFFEVYVNGKPYRGQVVMDYEKRVQYLVVDGRCNTTRLRSEFKEACVPKEVKTLSDTHLGTADDSLDVTVYELPFKAPKAKGTAFFTITNKLCIPVGETVTGSIRDVGFMATIGYTGIEPGIKDPRVFDKPRECSSVVEEVEMDPFEKFGFTNHKMSSLF